VIEGVFEEKSLIIQKLYFNLILHIRILMKFFRKFVEKIKMELKSEKSVLYIKTV